VLEKKYPLFFRQTFDLRFIFQSSHLISRENILYIKASKRRGLSPSGREDRGDQTKEKE
jgi:hypothetical protein